MRKKRILVLFPKDWDRLEFAQPRFAGRFEFVYAGFDLFRFPENAQLLTFDALAFVERVARRAQRLGVDGVVSNNEQFGALVAAAVARRLGLPGNDPAAVVTAHHKYYARCAMAAVAPEAVPPFAVFPYTIAAEHEIGLPLPCFVKPVKATFSVLARRIERFAELQALLRFKYFERQLIKRLVKPFNALMHAFTDYTVDAHHMIAEGLLEGVQVNMDGFMDQGRLTLIGIVDEHFYPGTMHFSRFEYPGALPQSVQARMTQLAEQVLTRIGYRHGFFNMELTWDPQSDRLGIVEINPRLASQLAYLYECVDGVNLYDMMLDLACGETPRVARRTQPWTRAASFAYRRFDGSAAARPAAAALGELQRDHPEARLMLYHKQGAGLAREMKWLGSHRYAVLNLCGRDADDLDRRYTEITRLLGYECQGAQAPQRAEERARITAPARPSLQPLG